jgi:hypothetical protein
MNKPKSQRITPATMTGEQIADAILYGTYTKNRALVFHLQKWWSGCGSREVPAACRCTSYPETGTEESKKCSCGQGDPQPLSRQYADGQSLTEILAPVLQGYRRLYREKFNLDMTPEQVIMFLVATNGVETWNNTVTALGNFPTATTA